MSASSCRPSCCLRHPMAKLQNVCKLGTIPLFARTGSSAYGNRHGITISYIPATLAKALSVKPLGWMLETQGVELCSKASGSLCWPHWALASAYYSRAQGPVQLLPQNSAVGQVSTPCILACLSPICCPFSLNAYPSLLLCWPFILALGLSRSTRGLRGSWSHGPGWDTPTTV